MKRLTSPFEALALAAALAAALGAAGLAAPARAHAPGAEHGAGPAAEARPAVADADAAPADCGTTLQAGVPDATAALPDVQAHYTMRLLDAQGQPLLEQAWTFERRAGVQDTRLVSLRKGDIEELWQRDARGAVSLARVFHPQQRAVDYTAGELVTLGIDADWPAIERLVDPRLAGCAGRDATAPEVAWRDGWGVPERYVRVDAQQRRSELTLVSVQAPQGDTPTVPIAFDRVDAADFGDRPWDAFVRHAEARDVRAGWRPQHDHD